MGMLPKQLLYCYGFTDKMINQAPVLLCHHYESILMNWLSNKSVREVTGYFFGKKFYFFIDLTQ
jgi:hypothetical protein